MSAVAELRKTLAERYADALPLTYRTTAAVSTGVEKLDVLLPNGGFPRGRVTVWRPGGGATSVLRAACRTTVERGERAVWVDAAGLVTGDHWPSGPLLLRPSGEAEALECVEELTRCGGFGLVVLGWSKAVGSLSVRLSRAVRVGGGAFVAVSTDTSVGQLRLESRLMPDWQWQCDPFGQPAQIEAVTIRVHAWSLGWSGQAEFRLPVLHHAVRLALDPLLVDRRGAQRKSSWPTRRETGAGAGTRIGTGTRNSDAHPQPQSQS